MLRHRHDLSHPFHFAQFKNPHIQQRQGDRLAARGICTRAAPAQSLQMEAFSYRVPSRTRWIRSHDSGADWRIC